MASGGHTDPVDISHLNGLDPAYPPGPVLPGPRRTHLRLSALPDRMLLGSTSGQLTRSGGMRSASIDSPAATL